jgi:tetratricopeptide (TPR) repeat protein
MKHITCLLVTVAFSLVLAGGIARAADEAQVLRLKAEQLAAEERCDEALTVLRRARALDARDARAALLEGQCAIRLRRYAEAIAPLEDARRLDPGLAEATLYLGVAQFHQGDLDAADRELTEAARLLPESAEAQLYHGLVLLERAENAQAAAALERAADLDPGAVDPAASYFAGRAWEAARERERAEQALGRAIAAAPGSEWAKEAERALERSEEPYRRRSPWARVIAGIAYDDNVVLRGGGAFPGEISDQDDWGGVWDLQGGAELFRNADWAAGVLGGYYGRAYADLGEFDTHFPNVTAWGDRSLGEKTYLRLKGDFGYGWVDYEPFLLVPTGTLSLHRDWGKAGSGRFFGYYQWRDYLFDLAYSQQNRDGQDFGGGYDHSYPAGSLTVLRGGAVINRYDSEIGEYTHMGYGAWLGVVQDLPLELVLDARARYVYQDYDNRSYFSGLPGSREFRRDHVVYVDAALERPITEHLKVSARYRHENNISNVAVFDYDRNIVGGFLTLELGSL